jgi:hypothetical protein
MSFPILDRLILDLVREAGLPSATRPQEHPMPDDRILIDLQRDGDLWHAHAAPAAPERRRPAGLIHADETIEVQAPGPASALEAIGQTLDLREASRLTRQARGETGPMTIEDAVERALVRDVQRVVAVLEDEDRRERGIVLRTLTIAQLSGIAGDERRAGAMGSDGRGRTIRALRRAQSDGVVVEAGRMQRAGDVGDDGDLLWSLAPEAEEGSR